MVRIVRVALAAVLAAATAGCGTIDRCDADTSPPKDGVSNPAPRHE